MKVLLVEDDMELANTLQKSLHEEGFVPDCVDSIKAAKEYLQMKRYNAIILDRILPDGDGTAFCLELRKNGDKTPLLLLSIRNSVDDIVNGLNSGADDYLTKPFRFVELVARIRTISKRSTLIDNHLLKAKDITLNIMSREVRRGNKTIELRNNEFNLLLLLMKRKNSVVSREEIVDHIWDTESTIDPNLLNVTIYNLRKKIERPGQGRVIHTVKGIGYKIVD
ncbi:response regulator transcription factor [Hydrogenimonas sp.]